MKKIILGLTLSLLSISAFGVEIIQGVPFTMTVTVDGTAPFQYQWSRNGIAVPGQTSAIIAVPAATPEMAGTYSVLVSNSAGSTTASIDITVKVPAPVVQPPSNAKIGIAQKVVAWIKSVFVKRT